MLVHKVRRLPFVLLLISLAAVLVPRPQTTAAALAARYTGSAQINGPVQLDVTVTPPVSSPGTALSLRLRLVNHSQVTSTPTIQLDLPSGLNLVTRSLPAGMTLNLQTNALNWLPVLLANGGAQDMTLQLRVDTADITQPEQTITAVMQHDNQEQTATIPLWVGVPPQINAVLHTAQVAVGQPIQLQADVSGSGPIIQVWQLGDGRRVEVNDPTVVYPATGIYQVSLEASNPLLTTTRSQPITVVPHPAAQFTADDFNPGLGQTITFMNQSGGQPPLRYTWDFGDGTTAQDPNPTHQYNAPGAYQVRLTVENSYGQSTAVWPVTVGSPPGAEMEIPPTVPAGQPLFGRAYGDNSVTAYRWNMGDGRSYEGAEVRHIYSRPGDFYVLLSAVNEYGATEIGRWIHVEPGTLTLYMPLMMYQELAGQEPDDLGITLPPVELDEPFVLESFPLAENSTPAEQLFFYINAARQHFGLSPLHYVAELGVAAQQHAADMAAYAYTGHTGMDGSTPAERLLFYGYRRAYAGETTAWGFASPREAVEFWVNSPSHRRIILNQNATDVGVGFQADYNAPNLWYWTAEFGNAFGGPLSPAFRLQEPAAGLETLNTTPITYSWNWPQPLEANQRFIVYLYGGSTVVVAGNVAQPAAGSQYALQLPALDFLSRSGAYEWQVKLEQDGFVLAESERRPIVFVDDPDLVLPTPTPTVTLTPTSTPTATPTPTPTLAWPTATPLPPEPTLPPLVTATSVPAEP